VADWDRAVFLHFEVDAGVLQSEVPFALDLRDQRAYVSLVAFTIRRMRFHFGGRIGEWICRPIATHEFLNVRTYVRYRDEPGIYFLAEWMPNRLSLHLGPRTFGLPYRLGHLSYRHDHEQNRLIGSVASASTGGRFQYEATLPTTTFEPCAPGSLDEFLLERYAAFTCCHGKRRGFRVGHKPWLQTRISPVITEDNLLPSAGRWSQHSRLVGGNYSPGVTDVSMSWPGVIAPYRRRALSVFFELP
jgi:uncharacterized protein YqjF (DUF2071 family)